MPPKPSDHIKFNIFEGVIDKKGQAQDYKPGGQGYYFPDSNYSDLIIDGFPIGCYWLEPVPKTDTKNDFALYRCSMDANPPSVRAFGQYFGPKDSNWVRIKIDPASERELYFQLPTFLSAQEAKLVA